MEDLKQIVVFELGQELYGIPIGDVKEIVLMSPLSKLIQAPDYIEGMTNLRGAIHVVLNLRTRFGIEKKSFDDKTKIIISNDKKVGFIVDEVKEIIHYEDSEITPVKDMPAFMHSKHISSILKKNDNIISVLNVKNMLSDEEIEFQTESESA